MNIAQRFTAILVSIMVFMLAGCAPTSTRQGTGGYFDDTVITSKVKAALAADPNVKARDVQVETFKGSVQLSGFVDSREAAQQAVQIARSVKGVTKVRNDMIVKRPGA